MKKIIILLVAVLVCSCGNLGYLVSYQVYSVSGEPEEIQVTYLCSGFTYNETVITPWTYKTFCNDNDLIGVSAFSGSEEIEIRVFFKKKGSWENYEIISGVGEVTVKGVINSI